MSRMTSNRPYLLRAFYEWIVDNSMTPYVVVNAEIQGVNVPQQYIDQDNKIVLNISPTAVEHLLIDERVVDFKARFSGVVTRVYAPINSVVAIYARENGRGMVFNEEEDGGDDGGGPQQGNDDTMFPDSKSSKSTKPGKPHLKIVK